jgi:hypothetical protein
MDVFWVASAGLASIPEDRLRSEHKGVPYARQTKPGATVRRLRFFHEIDGYRTEHVGQDLRSFACPHCNKSEQHFIESSITEVWLAPTNYRKT